jgi:arylsulfatase A-like enzyme
MEFSRNAVLFENAYAQSSWTRASVGTIMTGLYPSSHITERRLDVLPAFLPTIPRLLKQAGVRSYGFNTQPNVGPEFGFGKDFESYQMISLKADNSSDELHLPSDRIYESISRTLQDGVETPAFFYIHAVDTHDPYSPSPDFLRLPPGCDPKQKEMFFPGKFKLRREEKQIECVKAIYTSAVLQSDYYFGNFWTC